MDRVLEYNSTKARLDCVQISLLDRAKDIESKAPMKTKVINDLRNMAHIAGESSILLQRTFNENEQLRLQGSNQYRMIVELREENEKLLTENKHLHDGM